MPFTMHQDVVEMLKLLMMKKAWIINIACQKPTDFGYAAETWTYAKLTKHINENAENAGHMCLSTITKTSKKHFRRGQYQTIPNSVLL